MGVLLRPDLQPARGLGDRIVVDRYILHPVCAPAKVPAQAKARLCHDGHDQNARCLVPQVQRAGVLRVKL